MSEYYEEFLPRTVELLLNIFQGRLKSPQHHRLDLPPWEVEDGECTAFINAGILSVDKGNLKDETAVLVKNGKIELLCKPADYNDIKGRYRITREIDCRNRFLMPGMSDIHCHPASVIEKISPRELAYFPAQREKNCEVAIQNGTTFLRVAGGNWGPLSYLKREIDAGRLMGPDWICSYVPLIPRGGMWDFGPLKNSMGAAFLFGGKYADFIDSTNELKRTLEKDIERGADFIKTYQEEKPLYGFTEDTVFNMWTQEQLAIIKDFAGRKGLAVCCHAMFIKGARMVIEAGLNSLEHMTVDSEYTLQDAEKMAEKGIGIAPTLGVGLFLAIEMGNRGYANDPDLAYFKEYRKAHVPGFIERSTVPQLTKCYLDFLRDLNKGYKNDQMPGVGPVYPDRVTGFAHFARKSFENFRKAGVKVGIGTDGGLGTSFSGLLEPELKLSHYLGYSIPEVLRMATLGNMEIIGLDDKMGSIEPGKKADILVLGKNPLEDLNNMRTIQLVFKGGRLCYRNDA